MKTLASVSIACCLALAAAAVGAQTKDAPKPMTAADCKTYMDAAAKDAKMKNADKDKECKALADKAAAAPKK